REAPVPTMLLPCLLRRLVLTVPLVFVAALLLLEPARSDQEAGTAIPAESMYHTALPYNLYCSFNVARHHIIEAFVFRLITSQLKSRANSFSPCSQDPPLQYFMLYSLLNAFLGRPCVDCHAFEFMQRALQDLKKTAYNLDTRYPLEFSVGLSEKIENFVKSELT
ncbi:hypothetical protein ASZ78_014905, partial [Callipepla squamata]